MVKMTIQEACQRLGKSESTIRRWIRSGKLAAIMVSGAYDIPETAVNALSNDKQAVGIDQEPEGAVIVRLRDEVVVDLTLIEDATKNLLEIFPHFLSTILRVAARSPAFIL